MIEIGPDGGKIFSRGDIGRQTYAITGPGSEPVRVKVISESQIRVTDGPNKGETYNIGDVSVVSPENARNINKADRQEKDDSVGDRLGGFERGDLGVGSNQRGRYGGKS